MSVVEEDWNAGVLTTPDGRTVRVTFYDGHRAFPHARLEDDREPYLQVSVRHLADDATLPATRSWDWDSPGNYEFSIAAVYGRSTSFGAFAGRPRLIGLQLRIYDDAWAAFDDLRDLLAVLAVHGRHAATTHTEETAIDLDRVAGILAEHGAHDVTAMHLARLHATHPNHGGTCTLCGEHLHVRNDRYAPPAPDEEPHL